MAGFPDSPQRGKSGASLRQIKDLTKAPRAQNLLRKFGVGGLSPIRAEVWRRLPAPRIYYVNSGSGGLSPIRAEVWRRLPAPRINYVNSGSGGRRHTCAGGSPRPEL